jgi:tetratricopeptide (TPR) repeat protein
MEVVAKWSGTGMAAPSTIIKPTPSTHPGQVPAPVVPPVLPPTPHSTPNPKAVQTRPRTSSQKFHKLPGKVMGLLAAGGSLSVAVGGVAVALCGYAPQAFYNAGIRDAEAGNYTQAQDNFTAAIKLNPNWSEAYVERALVRESIGNYSSAADDDTKALQLNPKVLETYNHRAKVRGLLKNYQGVVEDTTHVIELNPSFVPAYVNRGVARYNLKDYKGAIDDATQALELDPKQPEVYVNRGRARMETGDPQGAVEDFNLALQADPHHASADSYQGQLPFPQTHIQPKPSSYPQFYNPPVKPPMVVNVSIPTPEPVSPHLPCGRNHPL